MARSHRHQNEAGIWVKCYHKCRIQVLSFGFWFGLTVGFLPEHMLWERIPGLVWIAHACGVY